MIAMNNVIDFINTNRDRYVDELKAYLAIPSISALPRARGGRPRAAPSGRADEMRRIGMQNVRLIETPGYPVVYGDWLGAEGAPTILFYGHYDVQPVDPRRAVGVAAVRGDRPRRRDLRARLGRRQGPGLHALQGDRGAPEAERPAAGQHARSSSKARRKSARRTSTTSSRRTRTTSRPTSSSSPTRRCSTAASRRSATACAASSTSRSTCAARSPTCTPARSAARSRTRTLVLAQILAQMKDSGGRIKIPGFYDDVRELTEEEREEWKRLPFNETALREGARRAEAVRRERLLDARARLGAADLRGERPARRLHRRRRQDGDPGRRRWPRSACASCPTRIPTRSRSSSRHYVKKVAPKTVEVKVTRMHGGKPWMTEFDNPYVQAAGRAIEQGFGKTPGLQPRRRIDSRSSPRSRRSSGCPSVLFGVGLPDENAHAPEREARSRQLPRRHHRVGVSVRRGRQDAVGLSRLVQTLAGPP